MKAPRQADIARVLKAALAAGLPVERVEVTPDGRIVIVAAGATTAPADYRL